MSRIRKYFPMICGLAILLPASSAQAKVGWEHFVGPSVVLGSRLLSSELKAIVEYEYGYLDMSDLANFSSYRITGTGVLDSWRRYRYTLSSESTNGFRLGVRVRDQLDLCWARTAADSRYRIWVDGVEQVSDPDGIPRVNLPKVHMRKDILSAAWRVRSLEWQGITPNLRGGMGWILLSQDGDFQATYRPPVDNSDSRMTIELGGGLDWNWRKFEIGADLKLCTFRWQPQDNQVPPSQIWSWMGSLHAGILF